MRNTLFACVFALGMMHPQDADAELIAVFDVTYTSRSVNGAIDTAFVPLTFQLSLSFQTSGAVFTSSPMTDPATYLATLPVVPAITPVTQSMRDAIPDVGATTSGETGLSVSISDGTQDVLPPTLPAQDSQTVQIVVANFSSSAGLASPSDPAAFELVSELLIMRDQSNFSGLSTGDLSNVPLTFDSFFVEALFVGNVFDITEQRNRQEVFPGLPPVFTLTTDSITYQGTATIISVVPLPTPLLLLLSGGGLLTLLRNRKRYRLAG